ncbi:MAG: branched-chain amino acid ABC transporter substrate-binding protein [Caldilinea sp. CFX5]|nr:branched-chain amino acid ABC transporter substrate-binding protein [Caldilinea sp. CFX5]
MRRLTMLCSLLVLVAMVLAACPAPAAPATGGGEAAAPSGGEAAAPAEGGCTDELGCVEVAAGAPIRLAYMLVVAGPDGSLGIDARRGAELAVAENTDVLGHALELVGEDSGCNAEGGQAAAQKLASDQSIVAVVGTSCSSEARAGAPILSDAGFTMVSPSATAPDLTDPAKHVPGFLRTAHNDKVQGQVAAQFVAEELGLKSVATIHDGSPYAEGLVNAFTENFTSMGGAISAAEAVGPTDTDMRPVLTKIAAGKPEMLYYPIFTASGGLITVQSEEIEGLGPSIKTMGADGLFSPDFLKAAGASALGMYLSSPDFSTFGTDYSEKFLPAYEAAYGEKPTSAFHAHAYDAVNVIVAAINAVGVKNDDGSLTIGRKALRDALYATKDFKGLTGNISCNENGDCADPKIAVYEITQENLDAGEVPTARIYPK